MRASRPASRVALHALAGPEAVLRARADLREASRSSTSRRARPLSTYLAERGQQARAHRRLRGGPARPLPRPARAHGHASSSTAGRSARPRCVQYDLASEAVTAPSLAQRRGARDRQTPLLARRQAACTSSPRGRPHLRHRDASSEVDTLAISQPSRRGPRPLNFGPPTTSTTSRASTPGSSARRPHPEPADDGHRPRGPRRRAGRLPARWARASRCGFALAPGPEARRTACGSEIGNYEFWTFDLERPARRAARGVRGTAAHGASR